jgi:hypothetical protein
MNFEKEECENAALVLNEVKNALNERNSFKLKELSDRTTHSSCFYQDPGSITTAVVVYALSKLIERKDYHKIKLWPKFVKKFNSILDLAILALNQNNQIAYSDHMQRARKILESISSNLKHYIREVLRKASINKGSKMHDHGISLEKTASLLGITRWELASYIGQHRAFDQHLDNTINIKKRAKTALQFFS